MLLEFGSCYKSRWCNVPKNTRNSFGRTKITFSKIISTFGKKSSQTAYFSHERHFTKIMNFALVVKAKLFHFDGQYVFVTFIYPSTELTCFLTWGWLKFLSSLLPCIAASSNRDWRLTFFGLIDQVDLIGDFLVIFWRVAWPFFRRFYIFHKIL